RDRARRRAAVDRRHGGRAPQVARLGGIESLAAAAARGVPVDAAAARAKAQYEAARDLAARPRRVPRRAGRTIRLPTASLSVRTRRRTSCPTQGGSRERSRLIAQPWPASTGSS